MKKPLPDLRDPTLPEAAVRAALDLMPHPEGGHYRELWRDRPEAGGRGAASAILFLLAAGERSHWHRVDASEIWIWQAGAPLALGLCYPGGERQTIKLGPDVGNGEVFQGVVPPHVWQEAASARCLDAGKLHRGARVPVRRLRACPSWLVSRIVRGLAGPL